MPISEKKKQSNKKWNDKNQQALYNRIQLVVPKGIKPILEQHAKERGESVNALMNRLIMVELGMSTDEYKRFSDEAKAQRTKQEEDTASSKNAPDVEQAE